MEIIFTRNGWEGFTYWIDTDKQMVPKIKELIKSINDSLSKGIKPEPLKYSLKGFWSRRITHEHRLVYKVTEKKGVDLKCIIIQSRYHYDH